MNEDRPPTSFSDWVGLRAVPNWARARRLGALVGIIIVLVVSLALLAAVWLLVGVFDPASAAAGSLGVGALVVAILGAPFVIWNTVIRQRALGFQKEGHITDRINKAVEQLGAEKTVKRRETGKDGQPVAIEETVPNIEVRIGGLLSLERIAQDSTAYDKGRDHVRVMEILCAYVRENAAARTAEKSKSEVYQKLTRHTRDDQGMSDIEVMGEYGPHFIDDAHDVEVLRAWANNIRAPRQDVSIAMRVIGRRSEAQRVVEASAGSAESGTSGWIFDRRSLWQLSAPSENASASNIRTYMESINGASNGQGGYAGFRIDLRQTNLQGADLSGLVLSGADLSGSRLEGADLTGVRMEGASLIDARLDGSSMLDAKLQGAILEGAHLSVTLLMGAQMHGANLAHAILKKSELHHATLDGALLLNTRLDYAELVDTSMIGATIFESSLHEAELTETRLDGAYLRELDLSEADLTSVSMRFARVQSTKLPRDSSAGHHLQSVFGDASVELPRGVIAGHTDWPSHWLAWRADEIGSDAGDSFFNEYQRWLADPASYVPPPPPDPAPE